MGEFTRWGILGLGRIGNDFAQCLRDMPDAKITAAGSRDIEKSKAFCAKYGGTAHGSYEDLVNDPNVDIIYVATPHNFHEEHVILCARAGKSILCEKPFAVSEKQAAHMFEEAEKAGVFIMEGLWSRFFPAWEYTREQVQSGKFGKIISIHNVTSWGVEQVMKDNRLFRPDLAGGALLDAGIYCLSVATNLLGPDEYPEKINAYGYIGETGIDEYDSVAIKYASGPHFTMMCGLRGMLQESHIITEHGTFTLPRHRNPSTVTLSYRDRGEDWRKQSILQHEFHYDGQGFQYEARHVQDCLRKGLKLSPRVPPKETLTLMRICDTIRKQINLVYPFEV